MDDQVQEEAIMKLLLKVVDLGSSGLKEQGVAHQRKGTRDKENHGGEATLGQTMFAVKTRRNYYQDKN